MLEDYKVPFYSLVSTICPYSLTRNSCWPLSAFQTLTSIISSFFKHLPGDFLPSGVLNEAEDVGGPEFHPVIDAVLSVDVQRPNPSRSRRRWRGRPMSVLQLRMQIRTETSTSRYLSIRKIGYYVTRVTENCIIYPAYLALRICLRSAAVMPSRLRKRLHRLS